MPMVMIVCLTGLMLGMAVGATSMAGEGDAGWRADPQGVERAYEGRTQVLNFHEERVVDYELPDPLKTPRGRTIDDPQQWPAQRAHLLALFREHVYGRRPGRPEQLRFEVIEEDPQAMNGRATLRRVAVHSAQGGREHSFEFSLFVPNERTGPAAAFVLINNRARRLIDPTREHQSDFWPAERLIERGYAAAAFANRDVAPDDKDRYREGAMRIFEGDMAEDDRPGDAWGALAAWGWGASRILDYFEQDPDVDAARVAVIGHSRGGKAALWAAAEDERFAVAISNNSGCGGAALSRRRFGERIEQITYSFPHWFCDNFERYVEKEHELPVDQHMLIGLIAPRAVAVASADEDLWADPRGEFLSLAHASSVYALWGHEPIGPEEMPALEEPLIRGPRAYHIRSGGHNLTIFDWERYMDFADTLWR